MSISEYAVHDDFFQVDDRALGDLDFPCCVCTHMKNNSIDNSFCVFCGHNPDAEDHYCCVVCGFIMPGIPNDDVFLASGTASQVGPLCGECICNISNDIKQLKNK